MAKDRVVPMSKKLGSKPNVPEETLKAAVGVAAVGVAVVLTERHGQEPKGDYLLQKCGQKHVGAVKEAGVSPEVVADWACAEARRRGHASGV